MLLPRRAAFGLALAIFAAFTANPVHAGLIPTTVTITPDHGNFRWTYTVVLPSYLQLQAGNYFSIYDFHGLVPGTASMPAGWTLSTPVVGPHPAHVIVEDDPTVPNLVWTYHGPTIKTGNVVLGNFEAMSHWGSAEEGLFVGYNALSWGGLHDTNITETRIPTPVAPPGVPEPGTLLLVGAGLSFLVLIRRVLCRS
jgi:hypothetical protein